MERARSCFAPLAVECHGSGAVYCLVGKLVGNGTRQAQPSLRRPLSASRNTNTKAGPLPDSPVTASSCDSVQSSVRPTERKMARVVE